MGYSAEFILEEIRRLLATGIAVGDGVNPITVQTANADGTSNTQNNLTVTSRLMGFNGATWDRLRTIVGDAMAATGLLSVVHMLWNGATYDRAASDATGKQKVSLYGKNSVAGDTVILSSPAGGLAISSVVSNTPGDATGTTLSLLRDMTDTPRISANAQYVFNSVNYDRARNNHEVTALASAARTAAVDSADLVNYNLRGVIVVIDATVKGGAAPSLVVTIQGKDTLSGKYYTLLVSAAIVAVGTTVLMVYPGATVAANLAASAPLPRIWRVDVAVANADSMTFSVGANYIL